MINKDPSPEMEDGVVESIHFIANFQILPCCSHTRIWLQTSSQDVCNQIRVRLKPDILDVLDSGYMPLHRFLHGSVELDDMLDSSLLCSVRCCEKHQ
jgi:hypothetical protein